MISSGAYLVAVFAALSGVQEAAVDEALRAPLLAPGTALAETQQFLKARLRPLEPPASAEEWIEESARIRQAVLDKVVFRGAPDAWRNPATGRRNARETASASPNNRRTP